MSAQRLSHLIVAMCVHEVWWVALELKLAVYRLAVVVCTWEAGVSEAMTNNPSMAIESRWC